METGPRVDLLMLSAYGPELRGMVSQLGESLDGVMRGLRVVAKAVGVGMPVAAAASSRLLGLVKPRAVIHLGTCGVYPGLSQYRPHDVIVGNAVYLLDHAVLLGKGTYPAPMTTEAAPDEVLTAGLGRASQRAQLAAVASPLSSTKDDALAAAVPGSLGAHVENLEAFSVAQACRAAKVPFGIVLGATHMVGARADEDFRQFERQASIAAAELATTWIQAGAQGLPHGR